MKIGRGAGLLISLMIVAIGAFALLLTGIWYTVIIGGLAASLLVRRGYLVSTVSSFVGGILAVAFVLLTLPVGHISGVLEEVGNISSIGASLLLALMFVFTAALTLAGALIGTFIAKIAIGARGG